MPDLLYSVENDRTETKREDKSMKKKVLFLTVALSLLFAGIASAASLWGTYKGNPIVRLTVDGKPVLITDVPVINYNNRTMIPIYLLQQAGIKYSWDEINKTIDISSQNAIQQPITQPSLDRVQNISSMVIGMKSSLSQYGIVVQDYTINIGASGVNAYVIYDSAGINNSKFIDDLINISTTAATFLYPIDGIQISLRNSGQEYATIYVSRQNASAFVTKQISIDQFLNSWSIKGTLNITPLTQTSQSSYTDNGTAPTTNNQANCAAIVQKYEDQKRAMQEALGASGLSRSSIYQDRINAIDEEKNNELALNGCQL